MTVAARAFTRSGAIYTIGVASIVPFGLVSLAVTTRYLGPADYGRLATLFAIASILTVLAGMGVLQGVLMVVYRAADEDADGDEADEGMAVDERKILMPAAEKRRLLGSGLIIMAVAGAAWCGLAALLSPLIAQAFLGSSRWTVAVLLMTASAWTGSIWRFVHQIWRVERHPALWSLFQALRPLLVVAGTVVALVLGFGINGVLVATAGGTFLACLISLFFSRSWFSIRPKRGDATQIIRAGMRVAPIIVARVSQANASVLLLSVIAPASSVGLFQAAYRIAQIPSFFANGFVIGWIPLSQSPIGTAGRELRGREGFGARVFTLLVLLLIGLTLLIGLGSSTLIRIAAPSLNKASDLVPLVAVGLSVMEVFHAYYRACTFPGRRWWYTGLHFAWLAPYIAVLFLGSSVAPTYAVAAAQIVASVGVLTVMVMLDHRGETPLPVPWARLGGISLVACACLAIAQLGSASLLVRLCLALAALLLFPTLLRAARLITRPDMQIVRSVAFSLVPVRMSRRRLQRRLSSIHRTERAALVATTWQGRDPDDLAVAWGCPTDLIEARVARGLRAFLGNGAPRTAHDAVIGRYLLSGEGAIERDMRAESIGGSGGSLVELHELDEAMRVFRRLRRRGTRILDRSELETSSKNGTDHAMPVHR